MKKRVVKLPDICTRIRDDRRRQPNEFPPITVDARDLADIARFRTRSVTKRNSARCPPSRRAHPPPAAPMINQS